MTKRQSFPKRKNNSNRITETIDHLGASLCKDDTTTISKNKNKIM